MRSTAAHTNMLPPDHQLKQHLKEHAPPPPHQAPSLSLCTTTTPAPM